MSIEVFPGTPPLTRPAPPNWGEITPMGETALVVRFALVGRWVSFPADQLKRWEHRLGEPELLTIKAEKDEIVIEGRDLSEVRAALDLGRLCELRVNFPRPTKARPGPQVRSITIETT
jgi:hypothetical protein